jgi:anhydro-N-acetylmuramic acid kinase
MMEDKDYRIVGMMSGTSLDGVDLAFCHFVYRNSWEYTLIAAKTYPYPPEIIEHIHKMQQESTTFLAFKKLEILYSEHLSHVIKQFISDHDLKNIDYISLHGHTIYHQPK